MIIFSVIAFILLLVMIYLIYLNIKTDKRIEDVQKGLFGTRLNTLMTEDTDPPPRRKSKLLFDTGVFQTEQR